MNVVVFGNSCGFGGAQTAFRQLVEFFLREKYNVGTLGLVGPNDSLPGAGRAAFSVRIDDGSEIGYIKGRQILAAALAARRHKPAMFVSVGLARSSCMLARLMPSSTFRVAQDFIYGRNASDRLLTVTSRAFDALAVQAPSMIGALRRQGYSALPINWLPCFPDPPCAGFNRIPRLEGAPVRLAYLGRLAANKGLDLLLKALPGARRAVPITVDIWGGGSEEESLRSLAASLPLAESVQFCGRYPSGDEFARLLCSYDGLILPSTGLEGLPLILLESMAYGVPFLTTRVGAIGDCCIDNPDSILVEPTLEGIEAGIQLFAKGIVDSDYSTERLISFYQRNFSRDAMAARWNSMLLAPKEFFSHGTD